MSEAKAPRALPNLSEECDLSSHDPQSEFNVHQAQQAFDRHNYKEAACFAQQTYLKAWNDAFTALRIWTDCLTATHEYAKAQMFVEHLKAAAPELPDGTICEIKNHIAQCKLVDATNACAAGLNHFHAMPQHIKLIEKVQQAIRVRQTDYIPKLPAELIYLIFQHLDQHFLVVICMAVSKSWYSKLAECGRLWHTLKIEPHRHRYANAMVNLHTLSDIGPNVHAIQVASASNLWSKRLALLAKNRCLDSLVSLSIAGFNLDTQILGDSLLQLQNITTLKIGMIESSSLTLGILFSNLPCLSFLHYLKLDISNGQLDAPLPQADNMRALRIDLRGKQGMSRNNTRHLLLSCPHLEYLALSSSAEDCLPIVDELGTHLWQFELGCFESPRDDLNESLLPNRKRLPSTGLKNIKIETCRVQVTSLDMLLLHHHETLEEMHLKINNHEISDRLFSDYPLERVSRLFIHESRRFQLRAHLNFMRSLFVKCTSLHHLHLAHAHNEQGLYQHLHTLPIRELVLISTRGYASPNLVYFAEHGDLNSLRSLTLSRYNASDPIVREQLARLTMLEELALLGCETYPRNYLKLFELLENHPRLRTLILDEQVFYSDAALDAIGKIKALRRLVIHCNPFGWNSLTGKAMEFKERHRMVISKYPQIQAVCIKKAAACLPD